VADPRNTLRDTGQAAIREVIGRTTIDGVLSEQRGEVERETEQLLQEILDRYESGLLVKGVQLLDAQPPPEVRDAFDDVIAAAQDRSRKINEAEGYANEVLPQARAESAELRQAAGAYRDAKIAESTGEAARFTALLVEYQKAPEVTRKRLYLETMEEVLPEVEKVIIEPGTANVLPYFPIGRGPGTRDAGEGNR
jgi:membrane protease subunit HflK